MQAPVLGKSAQTEVILYSVQLLRQVAGTVAHLATPGRLAVLVVGVVRHPVELREVQAPLVKAIAEVLATLQTITLLAAAVEVQALSAGIQQTQAPHL